MGLIAAIMLAVGAGQDDALAGIRDITIISAAPFALVMVGLCLALAKDLNNDPLMRRDRRAVAAVEQAVEHGTKTYGDEFVVAVKATPDTTDTDTTTETATADDGAASRRSADKEA
jgi:choline-glycine betaine transporter